MPALTARRTGVRLPAPPPCFYDPGIGLAADLGYDFERPNLVQRSLARVATTRFMSAVARRVMPALDRLVLDRSHGATTATAWLIGLPAIWVTTTGARTGERRTVPLLGVPFEDTLAILGTRFGHRDTPAWVYNLMADPVAEVRFNDTVVAAVARLAGPDEEHLIWERAASAYPGYALYTDRAAHRRIRVFVLEPK